MTEIQSNPDATAALRLAISDHKLDALAAMGVNLAVTAGLDALDAMPKLHLGTQSTLFTGIVASYFRAFEKVTDPRNGRSRAFRIRDIPNFDRGVHETLHELRNGYVAHIGQLANDGDVLFIVFRMEGFNRTSDGEGLESVWVEGQVHGSRARTSMAVGLSDVERLKRHLRQLAVVSDARLTDALKAHETLSRQLLDEIGLDAGIQKPLTEVQENTGNSGTIDRAELARTRPRPLKHLSVRFGSLNIAINPATGRLAHEIVITETEVEPE